jgi:hypothetical protein
MGWVEQHETRRQQWLCWVTLSLTQPTCFHVKHLTQGCIYTDELNSLLIELGRLNHMINSEELRDSKGMTLKDFPCSTDNFA